MSPEPAQMLEYIAVIFAGGLAWIGLLFAFPLAAILLRGLMSKLGLEFREEAPPADPIGRIELPKREPVDWEPWTYEVTWDRPAPQEEGEEE